MDEFCGAQVEDVRLGRRLIKLADRLGDAPSASIPGACNGRTETQAAYRFFDQARADRTRVGLGVRSGAAHGAHRGLYGSAPGGAVPAGHDRAGFQRPRHRRLGKLSYEAQRGMYVHPTYAVTLQRLPLGILDNWMWARPLGTLESRRWVEGYERVAERAQKLPGTRLVYVADREADMLELMQRAHALAYPADYVLRAQHNRCLPQGGKLWPATPATPSLGEIEFTLGPRHPAARLAACRKATPPKERSPYAK